MCGNAHGASILCQEPAGADQKSVKTWQEASKLTVSEIQKLSEHWFQAGKSFIALRCAVVRDPSLTLLVPKNS